MKCPAAFDSRSGPAMTTQAATHSPIYSDDKMLVRLHEKPGGQWVDVTMLRSRVWYPTLIQLAFILRGIAHCEDHRYKHGQGRDLMMQMLWDALTTHITEAELRAEYKLPDRSRSPRE